MGKAKRRNDRPAKRKFYGNRYTTSTSCSSNCVDTPSQRTVDHAENEAEPSRNTSKTGSASFQKLNASLHSIDLQHSQNENSRSHPVGYRLFDIDHVLNLLQMFPCPSCFQLGTTSTNDTFTVSETIIGLQSTLMLSCKVCKETITLKSSDENVNLRFHYAMFSLGLHYEQSRKFLGLMDLPPPVSAKRCDYFKNKIHSATQIVCKESMHVAAREIEEVMGKEVTISVDGTWQRRGFVSKNGIATALTVSKPSKVIDVDVRSNYCDKCAKAKRRFGSDSGAFEEWSKTHQCDKNHEGSAGKMESDGVLNIFKRSEEQYGLYYTGYLGDGDSKSYKTVAEADPPVYEGKSIQKLECCGHVQKRMGKHLMNKVTELKNHSFTENGKKYKGIGGVGKLHKPAIKRIQGHYGGAIRENSGDLQNMKKAIWGIWHHRRGEHKDCGTWCPGEKDLEKANKNRLPIFVCEAIKPVFETLSDDALLSKCLHGGTQNANESLHNVIWKLCPKSIFVGRKRLEIAVQDAVTVFNDGELSRLKVLKLLGLATTRNCVRALERFDRRRLKKSQIQDLESSKAKRQEKNIEKAAEEAEDGFYEAGAF